MDIERRLLQQEIRLDGDLEERPKIAGYAAVFNRTSENLGGFVERIEPGAFAGAIEQSDVRALINHDSNLILGRNTAGTLTLFEDEIGLGYVIDPPDVSYANDLLTSLARGDVNQSSFGFTVEADQWEQADEERGLPVRVITRVKQLYDVSPVTFPAYSQTSVAVREWVQQYSAGCVDTGAGSKPVRRQAYKNKLRLIRLRG